MQTFLPYPDFKDSVACLDNKRLGKQRVEVLQILSALTTGKGWIHHPATKMWKGCENALALYGIMACEEYLRRGFKDETRFKLMEFYDIDSRIDMPIWFGHSEFHVSHQSNLKRKYPEYYPFNVLNDLPYCWPTLMNGRWILRFKHAGAPQYIKSMEITI